MYFLDEVLEWQSELVRFSDTKFVWKIFLAILAVWVFVFILLLLGKKVSGKISYGLVVLALLVFVTLFIFGVSQERSSEGLGRGVFPGLPKLYDGNTWVEAMQQVIFGLSLGSGCWISLASRSSVQRNVLIDAVIIVSVKVVMTCIVAIAVFLINGQNVQALKLKVISTSKKRYLISNTF